MGIEPTTVARLPPQQYKEHTIINLVLVFRIIIANVPTLVCNGRNNFNNIHLSISSKNHSVDFNEFVFPKLWSKPKVVLQTTLRLYLNTLIYVLTCILFHLQTLLVIIIYYITLNAFRCFLWCVLFFRIFVFH